MSDSLDKIAGDLNIDALAKRHGESFVAPLRKAAATLDEISRRLTAIEEQPVPSPLQRAAQQAASDAALGTPTEALLKLAQRGAGGLV